MEVRNAHLVLQSCGSSRGRSFLKGRGIWHITYFTYFFLLVSLFKNLRKGISDYLWSVGLLGLEPFKLCVYEHSQYLKLYYFVDQKKNITSVKVN